MQNFNANVNLLTDGQQTNAIYPSAGIYTRGITTAVIRQPSSPGKVSLQKLKSRGDAMQSQ